MTIQAGYQPTSHLANGVQTVFGYDFKLLRASDLAVFLDGVRQSTGFTVSGVGNDLGGNVTFDVAPPDQTGVLLALDVPYDQEIDYDSYDEFPAEVHERGLDLAAQRDAQQGEVLDRTLKYDIDTAVAAEDAVLPEPQPSKAIGYDATGKLANITVNLSGSPVVNPLDQDLLSGGFSFVAQDGPGGSTTAKITGTTGVVDATEFTRQGVNLDARYAALVHGHAVFTDLAAGFTPAYGAADDTYVLSPVGWRVESQGGHVIADESGDLPQQPKLRFEGFIVEDEPGSNSTVVKNLFTVVDGPQDLTGLATHSFTGIPAGIDALEVRFYNVDLPSSQTPGIRIQVGGTDQSTGYEASSANVSGTPNVANSNAQFPVMNNSGTTNNISGVFRLRRLAPGSLQWVGEWATGKGGNNAWTGGGSVLATGELDGLSFFTASGNFVKGEVTLSYYDPSGTGGGGGTSGVDSFAGRTGVVVPQQSDYDSFFLTPAEGDAAYEVVGAVATHEAAGDPHPQYLTAAEGDAAYDAFGSAAAVQSNLDTHTGDSTIHFTKDSVRYETPREEAGTSVTLSLSGAQTVFVTNTGAVTINAPSSGEGELSVVIDGPSGITLSGFTVVGSQGASFPQAAYVVRRGTTSHWFWGTPAS